MDGRPWRLACPRPQDRRMTGYRVPAPSAGDRLGRAFDRVRHPLRTRALARDTGGFRAPGVIRTYPNDVAGRRLEAVEATILWHRGYRGPLWSVHDAIWRTGGPRITITYNRERVPAFLSPHAEREASRRGVLERR